MTGALIPKTTLIRKGRRPVVLQIGPTPGSSGGIASVIEETLKFESEHFEQCAYPSWTPDGKLSSFPKALRTAAMMCARARHWNVAHVHLSEYGSFLREGSLLLVARALGRPAVATLHGAQLPQHVARYPRLTRTIFNAASVILCLGGTHAAIVARISPGTPIRVVANPIDHSAFRPDQAPSRQCSSNPTFLFAGEVGYRKGHDRLIKAWDAVLETYPQAQLRIAGPLANGYETKNQSGVEYLGNLSRTALVAEMSHATATVLPSRAEVLPMTLIESHAQGTPTIYTKVGEWQVFEDAPGIMLIDTEGCSEHEIVASLSRSMIDLVTSPTTARAPLVEWARTRFSTQVVTNQLDTAYRDAIAGTANHGVHTHQAREGS